MSLKAELETWASALKAYDEEDFEKALDLFSRIADSSKILTNMGLIYATLGEHEAAVEQFNAATGLDQYLAVAYFQCGVSNFLLGRYDLSLRDFEEALLYLRGNQAINYEQLGLKFKLFSAEVLFNKGLSQIYLGNVDAGLMDMQDARGEKATDEHNVIDDAIADRGEGYTVFSIPVGVLYRPSENKLKNTRTKDYMGKAKLIATDSVDEAYTEFTGVARKARGFTGTGAPIPDNSLSSFDSLESAAGLGNLSRSQTVPPPRVTVDDTRPAGLMRSRTVLPVADRSQQQNVNPNSPNGRDGGMGGGGGGLQRSLTTSARSPMSPPGGSGPTRALSVRKNGMGMGQQRSPTSSAPPPPPEKNDGNGTGNGGPMRITEIYDDYIGGYADDAPPPMPMPPAAPQQRVAAWARNNANPANTPSRAPSTRAPSAYGSFSSSGASLRRKPTRRPTIGGGGGGPGSTRGRPMSPYEEEEEGYVSGEYDEPIIYELTKIRVKLHYQDDVRGMTLSPETPWEEFREKVAGKFGRGVEELGMKFLDEDGGKVTLRDDSDFELAVETVREMAKGRMEGKLAVWVSDL
ncbi:uncharacterized protein FOMMEDRAFT_101396 [Fomitiporia mediterranea MF3/22]|uniref:uncharacterized protein n=1 Tax=Fomitiporia mediterranea (strain MF3/22) TaxID=694068 RepID=UPI0004408772|nr:uncharacterized protein FOMMEDRAFT_101396 [Fomitiporia mediterranea MF3/22]EJD07981.1 hypothetical protein FOMMEDRAFT_101396 [Fomitiporia mediterranea MF3/22]